MIITHDDFKCRYEEIQLMDWIRTHRSGDTGIGKTLEDLLGIEENNLQEPDFGEYELKAGRNNSNSMLTLFTKAPSPRKSNAKLREKYGYSSGSHNNGEKILHATLNASNFVKIGDTGNSLKIEYIEEASGDKIAIISETLTIDAYWLVDELRKNFMNKYPHKLVYVKADSRGSGENEEFRFRQAYVCDGVNYDAFLNLLREGKIYVDLRIGQYHDGRTHDHGTGFRIKESYQDYLFVKHKIC